MIRKMAGKRCMAVGFIFVLVVLAAYLLGWFSRPRPWSESTGWNRIPADVRPGEHTVDDEPWIRWLGHAGFVIRWHGVTLLLDPNRSERCTVSKRIMEVPPALNGLGPVHALISHAHFDHLNQDTLVALPELVSVLLPAGSEVFLDRLHRGTTRIVPVTTGEVYHVGALRITPVRAAHNGNRFHPLSSTFSAYGYMIQSPVGTTLYVAGDTAFDNGWELLREEFHPDIAILPIGAYAPRFPLKMHHMNPEEAAQAAIELGVRKMIPGHFGTFTLSFDRPGSALPRFAREASRMNVPWTMPAFLTELDVAPLDTL
jgi:L-ascorbate metabolism protein UlaG (beta-lactamase superfamily)